MSRVSFLGCPVESMTLAEAVERVCALIQEKRPHRITALNANKLWQMAHNARLREIVVASDMVIPEYAIVWGAQLLGKPLRGHIGGIMLLQAMLPAMAERGIRPFFLGARAEIIEQMVARLHCAYPNLDIAGFHHGYFQDDEARVLALIEASRADVLVVAFGTPNQEYWIASHQIQLNVPVAMGVGGSFDVISGLKKDAPAWARSKGLEWLYRLAQDPSAYWKRYLITNTWFVWQVLKAKIGLMKA